MKNIQNLTIDINKKPFQTITANVGEIGSRFIRITILDNSVPLDLTGVTTYLYAKKADGTKVFNSVTTENIKNGVVLAELTSQILAIEGAVKLTLLLTKNGNKLISKQFLLNVDSSIVDDEAIESTNEFTALVDALGRVNNIDSRFENVDLQLAQTMKEVEGIVENVVDGHVEDTTCHVTTVEKSTWNSVTTLTLGVHTDGLIYIFRNGLPVGDGIEITAQEVVVGDVIGNVDEDNNIILSGDLENGTYVFKYENADGTFIKIGEFEINEGTISLYTNLLKTLEVHLNKRYSGSSNALASDGAGMFALIIPIVGDGSTSHTLRFANLKLSLTASANSTLYLLDSSQKNIGYVNGSSKIASMTSGLTISDNGKSAQIDFVPTATTKYVALSIALNANYTSIKASDISDYIITLDEEIV